MAYIFFSETEKEMANTSDIVTFLKAHGEEVKKCGTEYMWNSPQGKVSIRKSEWYSQYERVGGGAIGFLQKYYGFSYPDAVQELIGYTKSSAETIKTDNKEIPKIKELIMPKRSENMKRLYAYMLLNRCIDRDILDEFIKRNLIFESAEHHNAIFVGYDENGTPRHIQKRSTQENCSYKGNLTGSDSNYSFRFIGHSNKLYVFEAPIDMLAYISMHKKNWQEHSYVALCSTAEGSALQMLSTYPNLTDVYLCLDHDSAGIEGSYRVAERIHEIGNANVWRCMPKNKDWDEDLKAINGKEAVPSGEHFGLQYVKKQLDKMDSDHWQNSDMMRDLIKSKGYLSDQMASKLECFVYKMGMSNDENEQQEYAIEFSKVCISYCYLQETREKEERETRYYLEKTYKHYKPHHDNKRAMDVKKDLGQLCEKLCKCLKSTEALTKAETAKITDMAYDLAALSLQLSGRIELEKQQNLSFAPTM